MSLETTLEALKKYGATAVLVLWVLRQEARLGMVEDKLYNCYATMNILKAGDRKTAESKYEIYAILPHEINVKRDTKRHLKA